jgi:hypothetical protein
MESLVDRIIDYETGQLEETETIELFQELLDSGLAWQLQGHYGRTARHLMDLGLVNQARKKRSKQGHR